LFVNGSACCFSRNRTAALQATMDDRAIGAWRRDNAHPVADRGEFGTGPGLVAKAAADFGPSIDIAGHPIEPALFLYDARDSKLREIRTELVLKEIVPPETFQ
jgi:hypothetical protein